MRAARHLAGHSSVPELAAAIKARGNPKGLGTTLLRTIEREEKVATFPQLREIAEACGVDVAWFTADFTRLGEISDDPRRTIAAQIAAAEARAAERRAGRSEALPPLHEEAP